MRPNRKLSELLIRDLSQFSGMAFTFPDRLTKAEAIAVNQWAASQPQVVAAYQNRSDRQHQAVRTFSDLVAHYAHHHPETAAGEPAPWPQRIPTGREKSDEDPFADLQPDEADALLTWAKTRSEYDAYFDRSHPQHKEYVQQTSQLLAIIHPDARGDHGVEAGEPSAPRDQAANGRVDAAAIDALSREPAYLDRHHPGHRAAVDAVTRAYEQAYPSPENAGAVSPARAEGPPPLRALPGPTAPAPVPGVDTMLRIRDLQQHPAYLTKSHPEHATTVAAVSEAYQLAYPGLES